MFTLCPHCQFLVALDPATGRAPADCPRCGKPLAPPVAGGAGADATDARAASPQDGPSPPAVADTGLAPPAASEGTTSPPAPAADSRPKRVRAAKSRTTAAAPAPAADASGETSVVESSGVAIADPRAPAEPAIADAASPAGTPTAPEGVRDDARAPASSAAGDAATVEIPDGTPPGGADRAEEGAPAIAEPAEPAESLPARRRHLPSFAHPLHAPAARPGVRTIAVIAGLALLLVLQLLLADRARLAGDARWRPLLSALCGVLQCELPAWREPTAFTLLARDVRPARQGVLHVTATFRNDARWPQPWPALHLALQDVDGRTVGARTLRPGEYREGGDDARVTQSGLASGQSARVAFNIAEPTATVVAFTFDFR
ncbi:MAG TPA: DUF3426 domain-containing protein [Xanthomonadaceae bacterium]|nr:DUF3426 domain-containing protein [Xanthomonadaceae bacterium]